MIILALLIGVIIGGGLVYLWQTAHVKGMLAAHTGSLAVDKARLEEENRALRREKELIEKNFSDLSATYKAQFSELAAKILDDCYPKYLEQAKHIKVEKTSSKKSAIWNASTPPRKRGWKKGLRM